MILDEPFARLAAPAREEILKVFVEEAPTAGGAALLATHDLEVASRLADRVIVLEQGRTKGDHRVESLARGGSVGLPKRLRALYDSEEVPAR